MKRVNPKLSILLPHSTGKSSFVKSWIRFLSNWREILRVGNLFHLSRS